MEAEMEDTAKSEVDAKMAIDEDTIVEIDLQPDPDGSSMIIENATNAPVIIEQLDNHATNAPVIIEELHNDNRMAPVIIEELHNDTTIAPVIIEELDEKTLNSMDLDMSEFVEANALEMEEIHDETYKGDSDPTVETVTEPEERVPLTIEEEEQLTQQFLNGELTFSEYSLRMDQGAEYETAEAESSRKDTEETEPEIQKATLKKESKSSSTQDKGKMKKKRRTLPPVLQGLMGEANLRFARGEIDLATRICMEIIREVPSAPEPFHTLAMIYENDQPEKSLQFALIAAHLSPKEPEQWMRLATMSLDSGDIKQAITCYSKAIQASPKDIELYERRAELQERLGDKKGYLKGYMKLFNQLEADDGEYIIKAAKMLAKRHMQDNNVEQALEAMENIFSKCPDSVTLEEVNIMTEILITLKRFRRCLDILTKYTRIWVKYKSSNDSSLPGPSTEPKDTGKKHRLTDDSSQIEDCDIPEGVVVDLKAKFLICLIELDYFQQAEKLLTKFYENENPESAGDLFLDVAEAFMGKKKFESAFVLLDPLVKSENFSLAAVWLRHAECWVGCKDITKAIESYEIVRKLSPQHLGARSALAKLYQLKGEFDKAIDVLQQDPQTESLDAEVLYRRTLLLARVKKYDEALESGKLLFSRHCLHIRNKVEVDAITRSTGVRSRLETLQLQRLTRGEKFHEDNIPEFLKSPEPTEKQEFILFLQLCKIAYKQKQYALLQRMCFTALTSKKFEDRNSNILFLCLVSCIYNDDSYRGYNIVRHLVRASQRTNAWNLLNIIIQKTEDSRHNRFIMRLLAREDVFSYLHIMHANNCLVSGTYKYALNDYVSLFRVAPTALLGLLIAVTMLQMASQKFSSKKNQLVVQAIAFAQQYARLRGEDGRQEANYNTARLFHQIGLMPAAEHFYKQVLEEDTSDVVKQNAYLLDLKREAAYNLHLIYVQSENYLLAKMCLEQHIII